MRGRAGHPNSLTAPQESPLIPGKDAGAGPLAPSSCGAASEGGVGQTAVTGSAASIGDPVRRSRSPLEEALDIAAELRAEGDAAAADRILDDVLAEIDRRVRRRLREPLET